MSDETTNTSEQRDSSERVQTTPKEGVDLRLIGLLFLLPLVLMFVTALVCIAVVFARH